MCYDLFSKYYAVQIFGFVLNEEVREAKFISVAHFSHASSFTFGSPVAQMVEHGANNAKIMGSIPRESKSWSNVKL